MISKKVCRIVKKIVIDLNYILPLSELSTKKSLGRPSISNDCNVLTLVAE